MAIPPTAAVFPSGLDPHDQLDFVIPCGPILEAGEEIASYTLALYAESTALGLTIMNDPGREHALTEDARAILLWLEIDTALENNAAFIGGGVRLPMEVTIVTNSNPSRRRQFTCLVPVAQK